MASEASGKEAKDEATAEQNDPGKSPNITTNGGDKPKEKNANDSDRRAKPPKHDRYDWTHLAVLTATFLAAVTAAYEAGRLADLTDQLVRDGQEASRQQAELTRAAITASSRAWVVPKNFEIMQMEAGKPLKVRLQYENVGKEPALNVAEYNETLVAEPQKIDEYWRSVANKWSWCKAQPAMTGANVIYPSGTLGTHSQFNITPDIIVDDALVKGDKDLIWYGCFAYETVASVHHTSFCRLWALKLGQTGVISCFVGENAD